MLHQECPLEMRKLFKCGRTQATQIVWIVMDGDCLPLPNPDMLLMMCLKRKPQAEEYNTFAFYKSVVLKFYLK